MRDTQQVTCYICRASFPIRATDSHHVIPRSAGGSDDDHNRVHLCKTDHGLVDQVAHKLMKNDYGAGNALASSVYPSRPRVRKRLLELAGRQASAMSEMVGVVKELQRVMLEIPGEVVEKYRALAKKQSSLTGKRCGYARLMVKVLSETVGL